MRVLAITICWACLAIAAQAHADPLKDFEVIVEQCRRGMAETLLEVRQLPNGKWVKREQRLDGAVQYDVRKTDSLVAPFVAELSFTILSAAEIADTESAAAGMRVGLDVGRAARIGSTLRFAYRNEAWQPVDGRAVYEHRADPAQPFGGRSVITVASVDYGRPNSPSARCIAPLAR